MRKAQVYFTNIFKHLAIALFALPVVLFVLTPRADAATGILKQINFQGKVVNTNGTNVANASYNFLFCLYTVASPATPCTAGADNDAVWRESKSLTVTDGAFQTLLGDTTALPGSVDFNTDNIYLGVNFNSDGQMTPLVRFSAVPYAFNSDKIHGLTVTDTTGTFTLTNGKTLSVSNTLTFAGTDSTTITFQGTDTYVGRATSDTLTNKTIGSSGLTFSGATTDITTVSNEDLTLAVNGSGNFVFSTDFDSGITLGTAISNEFPLLVRSAIGNNATMAIDNLNNGDLFTASASGVARFTITNAGGVMLATSEGNSGDCFKSQGAGVAAQWTTCGGGGGTLQQAYDADVDGSNAIILTNATDGSVIFQTIAGTQFQVDANAAPTVDLMNINNTGLGTTTTGVDGLQIDFVQADDADGTDTNYGLNINVTAASADAGDILAALHLNVTGQTAQNREIGLDIGTGFDEDIHFASAAARVRMQDGGEISFTDGSMGGGGVNKDLPLGRIKEYFANANYGVFEAGGFINIDGSFYMENFVSYRAAVSADGAANSQKFGDKPFFSLDEAGTAATNSTVTNATYGCIVYQNANTTVTYQLNGVLEIAPQTGSNTNGTNLFGPMCNLGFGTVNTATAPLTITTPRQGILAIANKFIIYYKFRPSAQFTNTPTSKYAFFGVNNYAGFWYGMSTNTNTGQGGMWISNITATGSNATANSVWGGVVKAGTNAAGTVACSGANVSTNAWAIARIEARSTSDVRFFMDSDVSNGVALTECGSVTNNIPTMQMSPVINVGNRYALPSSAAWTMYVDLMAYVQDDPRELGGGESPGLEVPQEDSSPPPPPDPIVGADLAENYYFTEEDAVEPGDIVVYGDKLGDGDKASRTYDRKLLGVYSESPGLVMGQSAGNSVPVALTGRVPVKVSVKNGKIKIGDPITSSDIPGVGMKATDAGKILGTAMENFDGEGIGKIMVNINVGYYISDGQDVGIVENKDEITLMHDIENIDSSSSAGLTINATGSGSLNINSGIGIGTRIDNALAVLDDYVFKKTVRFLSNVSFEGITEFIGRVIFRNDVEFQGEIAFNKDTAGYAEIKKGQKFVDVTFEKEYKNQPVINISPTVVKLTEELFKQHIDEGLCQELEGIEVCQDKIADLVLGDRVKFAVQNQTTQGFLIILSDHALVDLTFSWQAQAVKDVRTARSDGPAGLVLPFEGDYAPSNKFGEHSLDPAIKGKDIKLGLKGHDGLDIAMPAGTPILAVDGGEVELENNDYGTTIYIKHSWGRTVYGHLSERLVEVGDKITKGQKIALSGNSGLTTGPHLHFGIKLNNSKEDNGYAGFENPWHFLSFGEPQAIKAVAGVSTSSASLTPSITPTPTPTPEPENDLPEGLTIE